MTGPDRICDILGIVLEQVVVGKQQIHVGAFMSCGSGNYTNSSVTC